MPEICEMNAGRIVTEVRAKRLSAVDVTEPHLDRLARVNPAINAIVQEFPVEALDAGLPPEKVVLPEAGFQASVDFTPSLVRG